VPGIQGPIDDAFTTPVLCVRGTGKPWNEAVHKWAEGNLKRFEAEWDRYFRGRLPIKDDVDVTPEDIASKNLILFGDPGSNRLIAEVLDRLPLSWDKKGVYFRSERAEHTGTGAERVYAADGHAPALVYPSPLTPDHYLVINSGHTFRAADFAGTNALLYPRLGDYALLALAPTDKDPLGVEVVTAGLFDEFWRVTK
jgi:hypothetical protein